MARSTQALQGDDNTYATIENQLIALNAQRDAIAGQIIAILNGAAFEGKSINEDRARDLIQQAQSLLGPGGDQEGD